MNKHAVAPNVLIYFTDQQRWDCSGLHGNPLALMPNFDRMAREGTHVAYSFTCQPVCTPARACLQTGQYATRNDCWRNGRALPPDAQTLAHLFNDADYHTGYIGKWHLAGAAGMAIEGNKQAVSQPYRGGYQEWLAVQSLEHSIDEYHTVLYDNDNLPHTFPGYRTDALTDQAIQFMDRNKDRPFFLMVSQIEPHHQNDKDDFPPPVGYRESYAGRWTPPDLACLPGQSADYPYVGGSAQAHLGGYWGQVKRLDESLGRITDALISMGQFENTIILFTSDHGCHFRTRNGEYKRSCHDSSLRVPTMLHGPGFMGGGQLRQLVSIVDLAPSLLDACSIPIPTSMQGRSILPLVRGDRNAAEAWPEEVFAQISESQTGRCVRTHRWKYSVRSTEDEPNATSMEYREEFLYDLKYDPYEINNLINSECHIPVKTVMRERLLRRMGEAGEKAPAILSAPERKRAQLRLKETEVLE